MATTEVRDQDHVKAVCFDFMGTCLDWHTNIVSVLPSKIPEATRSEFALEWRQLYFDTNTLRIQNGEPPEDIDETHRRTLQQMLVKHAHLERFFTEEARAQAVAAWHHQTAWDDVSDAVRKLKDVHGWEVFVHANGTTRLQLDLVRSSGLSFDMLFSSQLLGVYKPRPESYHQMLQLIRRRPSECVMVAAHASDLRGAKAVGMKTVYIHRWTDDVLEDLDQVRAENDAYLEDMRQLDVVISNL